MKTILPIRAILSFIFAVFFLMFVKDAALAQEQGGKEKILKLKIVTDDNGKVTVIDTTITTTEGEKEFEYEFRHRDMDRQLKQAQDRLKHMETELLSETRFMDIDSMIQAHVGDSLEEKIILRGLKPDYRPCLPEWRMFPGDEDCLKRFQYEWQDAAREFSDPSGRIPGPLQSLLESVPMGHIKGFRIKDRRDGKRIIIDMDDEPVMIIAPRQHGQRGARRIIIDRDIREINPPEPPEPPAPPEPANPDGSPPEKG